MPILADCEVTAVCIVTPVVFVCRRATSLQVTWWICYASRVVRDR